MKNVFEGASGRRPSSLARPLHRSLAALLALAGCAALLAPPARAQGVPIGFEEDFALATDRSAALAELVPGTEDYYFYSCLDRQNAGDLDAVDPLLRAWVARHGENARTEQIRNRQALLLFDRDPAKAYAFLTDTFNLSFGHQRELPGEKPDLPTALDPALLVESTLAQRALSNHPGSASGLRGAALARLAMRGGDLDSRVLGDLLDRLDRADLPGMARLVARDLDTRESRGFGTRRVHGLLLLSQLEECATLRPELLTNRAFVDAWIRRLLPNEDVNWRRDRAARLAYLERLQGFADRLPATFNSFKAHVLHHRLELDLEMGAPDAERLRAYLALPRRAAFTPRRVLENLPPSAQQVDSGANYPTGLDAIGDDTELVRDYLAELLRGADSFARFTDLVEEKWLGRLFAETKILAGLGDMERWYSLLDDPAYYEQLEQRVDLEFPRTQRTEFGVDDPVEIALDVKNVETLLVKVFEIDARNSLVATGRDVDASIDLDGIVAGSETTTTYDEPPLRRVRRNFRFDQLQGPGVWIVEFIGNGVASRAVVRKGGLHVVDRTGSAGHVFRVFDENGVEQEHASILFGGRSYEADGVGEITLPYSTDPGRRTIVVQSGRRTSLATFRHADESYELRAGIHVEREALRRGGEADLVVRPLLLSNGHVAAPSILENVVLVVWTRDRDGNTSTLDVRDPALTADGEYVRRIPVPNDVAELRVTLRANVRNISRGQDDVVSASRSFVLNAIDPTDRTASPLLGRTPQGWYVDVVGRNGEKLAGRPVTVRLELADYTDALNVALQTDARGRVALGPLDGVTRVSLGELPGSFTTWLLDDEARTFPPSVHGVAGETLRVPYLGRAGRVTRETVSFQETRQGLPLRDAFEQVTLANGYVELRGLAAGEYTLRLLEPGATVDVSVTDGEVVRGIAVGRDRVLELGDATPLQVTGLRAEGDGVVVELAGAGASTRVHVHTSRYASAYDAFADLAVRGDVGLAWFGIERPDGDFRAERDIGDEFRYVLERRLARIFPGNMLRRPGLLLNPWELEETNTTIGLGGGSGGAFGGRRGGRAQGKKSGADDAHGGIGWNGSVFANLDFLPKGSPIATNLRPDADGRVRVPLDRLGDGRIVHVVAIDGANTVVRTLVLPEFPLQPRDLRQGEPLDATRHFGNFAGIEFLAGGSSVDVPSGSDLATYATLADVYQLFRTLAPFEDLARFEPLVRWSSLTEEEKRSTYSELACHEVHYFLHEKDPAFFDAVVRPYLANKAHKTFMDLWLLDRDVSAFLDPWAFERLNVFEKILLSRSVAERRDDLRRHVREAFELLPPALTLSTRAVEKALAGLALSRASGGGPGEPPQGPPPTTTGSSDFYLGDEVARNAAEPEASTEDGGLDAEEGLVALDQSLERLREDRQEQAGAAADKDADRRSANRELYRAVDETRALVENDWWHVRVEDAGPDLVGVDAFWRDFAESAPDAPFFSTNFTEAAGSLTEMLLALAVLDLPQEQDATTTPVEDDQVRITSESGLLVVRRETRALPLAEDAAPVLVSQDFYRLDDRYVYEDGVQLDKFVTAEYLVDTAYGCRIVVTNPTSAPRTLQLLVQVPVGAIPVLNGSRTRGVDVRLQPFGTSTFEYAFYFPSAGTFPQYPVQVEEDGSVVAFAEPDTFEVLVEPRTVDTRSWEYVSQVGTLDQVFEFLDGANLLRLDLSRIAWRMRDRAAYDRVIGYLRERFRYEPTLWSYGVRQQDARTTREWLAHQDWFAQRCGLALDSPLLTIDPVERKWYQHVEFDPLVNGRAHRFGRQYEILNGAVARQYRTMLAIFAYRPQLDDDDLMEATYYLLLQDRVADALDQFARIDPQRIETRLQYDYLAAYLDFYTDDHARARGIAERYLDHPVERWRELFREVVAQLDEAEGRTTGTPANGEPGQRQGELAAGEPSLDLRVEGRTVHVTYANLASCEVNYHPMDVELLFSGSPFVQQGPGSFAYVVPRRSDVLRLDPAKNETTFELPDEFRNANLSIEVRAGGIARRETVFAGSLSVQWIENFGQVRVTRSGTGELLPKVYVKVFAKLPDGSVRFHKDGYTDLRGRFDYASLSGSGANDAVRYAVLVLSDTDGAVVKEVAPPAR
ncbi:MAG: hypothetical protein R3F34_07415 [Planctomycetota bacterium]